MFQKNDKVQWQSQAGGVTKVKVGEVQHVLQPGQTPSQLGIKLRGGEGMARNSVSYLVQAGKRLYWPRTNGLAILTAPTTTESQG